MSFIVGKIINTEQDIAGKWRVWCEVDEGDIIMLKYSENPSAADVLFDANKYIANLTAIKTQQIIDT